MNQPNDPQRMGRVLHRAMEEVLGKEGLRSVLQAAQPAPEGVQSGAIDSESAGEEFLEAASGAFSLSRLKQVLVTLERQYGTAPGKGLALRIGRACFAYGLREYGEQLGLTATAFRLLPFPVKLKRYASALAGLFGGQGSHSVRVQQKEGKLLWQMEPCPFCTGEAAYAAGCLLPVGVAEESLYWLSGGKMFSVEEIACITRGDAACIVQVDETPLS